MCNLKRNQIYSLKRTRNFKGSQSRNIEMEVKLEVLDDACHITSTLIALAPKVTLLHLYYRVLSYI